MKKIILMAFIALFMVSCSSSNDEGKYNVKYKIYYPNNTKEFSIVINAKPYLGSDRGTNYLKEGSVVGTTIAETSAPIEIVECTKIE